MDWTFTCHLSYLIKFYVLGLIISGVLNSYTFYEFGYQSTSTMPTDSPHTNLSTTTATTVCSYNHDLFKQSIVAIFTGFFGAQLLVVLLAIPSTAPTNSADNRNYKTAILVFLIGFIITSGLTILSVYHFVDSRIYEFAGWLHHLDSCSQFYYNTVFTNTILSAIPVCVISICYILYMIGLGLDTMLDKCCMTTNTASGTNNNQPRRPRINKQTQTGKQKDTTPKFINPSTAISMDSDTISFGSAETYQYDDEFQMDALEITPAPTNSQFYPSRKYDYSALTNTDEKSAEDMMPLLIHNYK